MQYQQKTTLAKIVYKNEVDTKTECDNKFALTGSSNIVGKSLSIIDPSTANSLIVDSLKCGIYRTDYPRLDVISGSDSTKT